MPGVRTDMRLLRLAAALLVISPTAAPAQTTTPWGDPDLQGVWSNQTPVPLERPATLKDKRFLYEVGCHEGNIGLRGILGGARAEEQSLAPPPKQP